MFASNLELYGRIGETHLVKYKMTGQADILDQSLNLKTRL